MKSLAIIICGFLICWFSTDLSSDSIFLSVLAPGGILLFLIALGIWIVMLFHFKGINQNASGHGSGSGGLGDWGDGGDC